VHTLATSFILGYHGCDASVAEKLLWGDDFKQSTNAYDWLGHGIYFWEANPVRGLEFAKELKLNARGRRKMKKAAVVGAAIDLGLCLDLTTSAGIAQLKIAHRRLEEISKKAGFQLPRNHDDQLRRNLDCAVIQMLHQVRSDSREAPIDTVRGIFTEGDRIYPTSGFYEKTHVQICVCNPLMIKGVFRVPRLHLDGS
jgi:hypothetical protein